MADTKAFAYEGFGIITQVGKSPRWFYGCPACRCLFEVVYDWERLKPLVLNSEVLVGERIVTVEAA